jgi:hypothetical protein
MLPAKTFLLPRLLIKAQDKFGKTRMSEGGRLLDVLKEKES